MMGYAIVRKYVTTRSPGSQSSTTAQREDMLNRVMKSLERDFGVVVTDDKILGLSGKVLIDYYNSLVPDKKPSTLNSYVCTINPFLRWAISYGAFEGYDPATVALFPSALTTMKIPEPEMIPEDERKSKYIQHEQARELLESPVGRNLVRDKAIIALFLYTGLRASELCSLTLGSVLDRPRGELYVRRKGGKYAVVLVNPEAYQYLDAYLETRDQSDHSQPLFMTTHGNPCSRIQLYRVLAYKQKAVGAATGPHALRHSFISEADRAGGAAVARDLANQRSLKVTNRYDHTTAEQRRAAIDSIRW